MEKYLNDVLKEVREELKVPLEIKKIGKSYYLYHSTTYWDKKEKKRKKFTRYIGKVTKKGLIKKDEERYKARGIYEYGNGKLLYDLVEEISAALEEAFPYTHKEIKAMGIVKVIRDTPIKMVKGMWEKLHLSLEEGLHLSPSTLSEKIREIGRDREGQEDFYNAIKKDGLTIAVDLSSIFSYSRNLRLAEKGYNKEHLDEKQINFLMMYSIKEGLPIYLRCTGGSIREIKIMKQLIKEVDLKGKVLILDRGFSSYEMVELLQKEGIKYIIGLQRGFTIIDYDKELTDIFTYRRKGIYCGREKTEWGWLYLYEDIKLKAEEESNYIEKVEEGKKRMEELRRERKRFGRIGLLTNLDLTYKEVYSYYKQREEIELVFDGMKNELENDKTYLSDEDGVRGYFFICFIAIYLYFKVLQLIKKAGLTEKLSVKELLHELSKVYLICYKDGKKHLSEIPKKTEELCEKLNINLFPKNLRS